MYQQGGYVKKGKIPGPASKTLFKSINRASSQTSTATNSGESGMDSNKRSLTLASAISDCWNNTSNSSRNFSGHSIPSSANINHHHRPVKKTCMFCYNLVLIPASINEKDSDEKRSRMLKNFCFHLQISSKDIPQKCQQEMFPLCKTCEELVKQLWDFQGMLDKIRLKMSKLVTKMARTVVDGEILNPNVDRNSSKQQQIIMKMRDMILQGYRNKLLVKQKLRDNLVLGNPIGDYNSTTSLKLEMNNDDDNNYSRSFNSSLRPSPSSCGRSEETVDFSIIGNHNDSVEELDVIEEIEVPQVPSSSSSSKFSAKIYKKKLLENLPKPRDEEYFDVDEENDEDELDIMDTESAHHQENNYSYWTTDSNPINSPDQVVTQYNNENNCTFLISNIHGSDESCFTAESPNLVQIKQELHNNENSVGEEDDFDVDVEGDVPSGDEDDIYMLEPRKRRLLFEGVEIYKCTGSKPGVEYLQCSICNHTIENPKRLLKGDVTTITKLKIHIQTAHPLAIPSRAPPPPSKQRFHGCRICDQKFTSQESLRQHRITHPSKKETIVECDICGRPIKGGSEFNLLIHKFSHKNDEERKAAISANEKGTYNARLSKRKKTKKSKTGRTKKRPYNRNSLDGNGSKEFICDFCNRTFSRKCYLTLHKRIHNSKKRWPNMNADQVSTEDFSEGQEVGESEPPILLPQQVPVVDYPRAQNNKECSSTINTAPLENEGMDEFCNAIGIVRIERNENLEERGRVVNGFMIYDRDYDRLNSAPILKREVIG